MMNSNSSPAPTFAFVEPSIARTLELQRGDDQDEERVLVELDPSSGVLTSTVPHLTVQLQDLVPLACQCDALLLAQEKQSDDDLKSTHHIPAATFICKMRASPFLQVVLVHQVNQQQQQKQPQPQNDTESSTTDDINSSCWIVTSTLLALNALESAIRQAAGFSDKAGNAPLLTQMLQKMSQDAAKENHADNDNDATSSSTQKLLLLQILRLLLLPTGLNLRNLLWHGFVAEGLPRPWLALVVVLQRQVQSLWNDSSSTSTAISDNNKNHADVELPIALSHLSSVHPRLQAIVLEGRTIRWQAAAAAAAASVAPQGNHADDDAIQRIRQWLPKEHRSLWRLCTSNLLSEKCCPWITCAILLLLLEHGLRLEWCRLHHRPDDKMARPGQFYVTLDGHGQRHKHNLLLHPYVYNDSYFDKNNKSNSNEYGNVQQFQFNQLSHVIGANTMALLTDLLVSPTTGSGDGGPNARACLSHGLLDVYLETELQSLILQAGQVETMESDGPNYVCSLTGRQDDVVSSLSNKNYHHHWDIVDAILMAMAKVASASVVQHHQSSSTPIPSNVHSNTDDVGVSIQKYRPVFSFTAVTIQRLANLHRQLLGRFQDALKQHHTRIQTAQAQNVLTPPPVIAQLYGDDDIESFNEELERSMETLFHSLGGRGENGDAPSTSGDNTDEWTVEHLLKEHRTNQQLAQLGATRLLLKELAQAVSAYVDGFETAIETLSRQETNGGTNTNRSRRRCIRVLATAQPAWQFFCLSTRVALASLLSITHVVVVNGNDDDAASTAEIVATSDARDLQKAVKRTRMIVSTVDTYLLKNAERAFEAMETYAKGKAVQKVLNRS